MNNYGEIIFSSLSIFYLFVWYYIDLFLQYLMISGHMGTVVLATTVIFGIRFNNSLLCKKALLTLKKRAKSCSVIVEDL